MKIAVWRITKVNFCRKISAVEKVGGQEKVIFADDQRRTTTKIP